MLARDYCEIINQSIHQIVEASTLAQDGARIIPGEITARNGNTYTISYSSGLTIDGQSYNGSTYNVGDQIWFLYAEGSALIQGINLTQAETPIYDLDGYEDFIKIESHNFAASDTTWYLTSKEQNYTRLGLEGIFSGNFSIDITLFTEDAEYLYTITPKDLIGTTLGIQSLPLLHKKGLAINLETITAVKVSWTGLTLQGNIKVSLGRDLASQTAGATLLIDDTDLLTYKTKHNGLQLVYSEPEETGERTLKLEWVVEEDGIRKGYTQSNATETPAGTEIRWYRWKEDYQGGDDIVGLNSHWLLETRYFVDTNENSSEWYTYSLTLDKEAVTERIKAAIIYGTNKYTVSNEMVFTNEQEPIPEVKTSISITSTDLKPDGRLPYFGYDKMLKADLAYKALQPHTLTMKPNLIGQEEYTLESFDEAIASFEWKVPSHLFDIVLSSNYNVTTASGYHVVSPARRDSNKDGETWIGYWPTDIQIKINNNGYADYAQVVYCTITLLNGKVLEGSLSFTTPVNGVIGSNNFIFTHLYDENGIEVTGAYVDSAEAKTYTLTVEVFDMVSEESVPQTSPSITWWKQNNNVATIDTANIKTGAKIIIPLTFTGTNNYSNADFTEAYTVLKISGLKTNGNNTFSYFIPITRYFEQETTPAVNVPSKIYYDNAGQFYKSFSSQTIEGLSDGDYTASLTQSDALLKLSGTTIQSPLILDSQFDVNKHWDTEIAPFYFNVIIEKTVEGVTSYYQVQPILLETVLGFSSAINEWDGNLKIDEQNNHIFSSAYIAGTKTDGKFTGAILGTLGKIADNTMAKDTLTTGLFGYKNDRQVYALKDDGSLVLGASGNGQITIDGSKGSIKSGNFDGDIENNNFGTTGSYWDLESGLLITNNGHFRGDIVGGSINIKDNFIVNPDGNVTLNGNITWGVGASPTQVVYAANLITKPADNKLYEAFPSKSDTDWHTTFTQGQDYYGSYTYDGGNTWGEPIPIVGISGAPGNPGESAPQCFVESSLGTLFEKDATGETTLIARIYVEGVEVDPDGSALNYKWFKDNVQVQGEYNKELIINITELHNVEVHFEASEKI